MSARPDGLRRPGREGSATAAHPDVTVIAPASAATDGDGSGTSCTGGT